MGADERPGGCKEGGRQGKDGTGGRDARRREAFWNGGGTMVCYPPVERHGII